MLTATDYPKASNISYTSWLGGLTMVAPTFKAIGGKGQALIIYLGWVSLIASANLSQGIAAKLMIV